MSNKEICPNLVVDIQDLIPSKLWKVGICLCWPKQVWSLGLQIFCIEIHAVLSYWFIHSNFFTRASYNHETQSSRIILSLGSSFEFFCTVWLVGYIFRIILRQFVSYTERDDASILLFAFPLHWIPTEIFFYFSIPVQNIIILPNLIPLFFFYICKLFFLS